MASPEDRCIVFFGGGEATSIFCFGAGRSRHFMSKMDVAGFWLWLWLCLCLALAAPLQAESTGRGGDFTAGGKVARVLQLQRDVTQVLEANALLEFKNNVTLDPYLALNNWLQGSNPCSWYGVICDSMSQHVLKLNLTGLRLEGAVNPAICGVPLLNGIDLSRNYLSGSVPDFGNCTFLQDLRLDSNNLTGPVPSRLGSVRSLEVLFLSHNQLVGSIPGELFLLNGNLLALHLDGNLLNGTIPESLTNCSRLYDVQLSHNSLTGMIPQDLGSLSSLQYLNLSNNMLSGMIPPSLTSCSKLRVLDLASNKLTGEIPAGVGSLIFLERLHLEANNLTGLLPASITNCSILMELVASRNKLGGRLPVDIGRLSQLQTVDLSHNNLTGGIPPSLLGCLQLSSLNISYNPLGGDIPPDIGSSLTQLTSISTAECNLTGSFPVSLSNCTLLQVLEVSRNSFLGGQLPDGFAQGMVYLRDVDLGFNQLEGRVPSSFGVCLNLLMLDLQGNRLTGGVPPELGNATSLEYLVLANNQLEGGIPASLSKLENLRELDLQGNKLNGTMPDLSNCKQLSILELQFNNLSGPVPTSLGLMYSMKQLSLTGNQFEGGIPENLGNLSSLQDIDLSRNRLTGRIPGELAVVSLVFGFNLSHNLLSGPIPAQLGSLNLVSSIDLSSNLLTGGIPADLKGCTTLQSLDLSHNPTLGGPIPPSLGDLHKLQVLALSNCSLDGAIPEELGSSSSQLHSIDFSYNNLSGVIPASLGDLPLFYLNLSFNSLEGPIPQPWQTNPGISSASFSQNPALCGALLSRPCATSAGQQGPDRPRSKGSGAGWIGAGIGVAGFLLVVISSLLCWRYCGQGSQLCWNGTDFQRLRFRSPFKKVSPFRYTEEELAVATEGFSDNNKLGSGTLGTVHKGVLSSGRLVAVKRFRFASNTKITEKLFREEGEKLTKLRHQNLVRVFGCFSSKHSWKFIVMEYIDNWSLEKYLHPIESSIEGCTMDWALRIDILIGVAQGLAFLHHAQAARSEQIVHGNLKPSNILLDADMQPQLVDFGLAKIIHGSNISSASLEASVGYTAPEHANDPSVRTPAGDVYSFGVVILEVLTQQRPGSVSSKNKGDSLPTWVGASYPHQMLEILDPYLLANLDSVAGTREGARKAVSLVAQVGLLCAHANLTLRPNMHNVVGMLQHIRAGVDKFFGSFRASKTSEFYDALSRTGSCSSMVSSETEDKQGTQ